MAKIKTNVYGLTDKFDFDVKKLIKELAKIVCNIEKLEDDHVVSFIIVDNEKIHEINKEYRNIDRPTDVISFANIDSVENEIPYELGDIYISFEKVKEQATSYGHSEYREFAFLVTHGYLHLLGYDHMVKEDEVKMFKRQDEILDIAKIYR